MAPPQDVVFGLLQGAVDCRLPEWVFNQTSNLMLIRRQAYVLIATSSFSRLFQGLPEDTSDVTYPVLNRVLCC
jgi:hypothetical protein